MSTFSSNEFIWDKTSKTFSAEASFLTKGSKKALFLRIYPDAIDLGIVMISSKTGKTASFVVEREVMLNGDLESWVLIPTKQSVAKNPNLTDVKVVIFND